ncbi:MAG: HAD-IA family hydrolase [Candidatus Sumerlaeaceae bacterium]|nr:HAD-IA family hydrolase [Candidatus Sumerlaeaceae bacterium]
MMGRKRIKKSPYVPVEWVFFDAGGTLLGTNPEEEHWYEQFFIDACREQGVDVSLQAVHEALHEANVTCPVHPRCSTPEQVRHYWEHIYGTVFGKLLPHAHPLELARHYIDRFERGEFVRLFPDTLDALVAVRQSGRRAAIVSNFGEYLQHFLERCEIAYYFEFAVISACVGCEKPQPEIFRQALHLAGARAEQVLFVGDSLEEDFFAARRVGMRAVLVDRHNKHNHRDDIVRVRRLDEIVNYL